ncbi:unnamed protein product [Adineta ricciae]|uniref:Uncharacterized protein n=1 Tax=Adineta ricciae TaxID=249248 RepID=A0A815THP6_ADIRI|nr:unnamed protein product [Adineta ricciae]CAF1503917.1 unnamed protein product [Adineta ricciae]
MFGKKPIRHDDDDQHDINARQGLLLIWLDSNFDPRSFEHITSIALFQQIIPTVKPCTDKKHCMRYIQSAQECKIFLISSGSFGEEVVPNVHDMPQIDSIFIFCGNKPRHEQWARKWSKVRGVFTEPISICKALQMAIDESEAADIPVHIMSSSKTPTDKSKDTLDPIFMYTKIAKEILLTIQFNDEQIKQFTDHCRELYADDTHELENIEWLEKEYRDQTAIWWYTCDCFLYRLVNRALREMDMMTIIETGFFIADLHREIEQLHSEQYGKHGFNKTFKVFRGQSMPKEELAKLTNKLGGLISFNKFLSTGRDRQAALRFAHHGFGKHGFVGVLFTIIVDPSQPNQVPFASLANNSYYTESDEILFSTHTIFRILDIKPVDRGQRVFEVTMTLTNDTDESLEQLAASIHEEMNSIPNAWCKLVQLLTKIGQFKQAEQMSYRLLRTLKDDSEKVYIYKQLGSIKADQHDYDKALEYYNRAVEIQHSILPSDDLQLASSYDNISRIYQNMEDHSQALSLLEKALKIKRKILPDAHLDLASSYENIGELHSKMNNYTEALSYYEKALKIRAKSLPPDHPDLAIMYTRNGTALNHIGKYEEALHNFQKALNIQQKLLPPNHPDIATSYTHIGMTFNHMTNYQDALHNYEQALKIQQATLPPNHPLLAASYDNIGSIFLSMGQWQEALGSYEKALHIKQNYLSPGQLLPAAEYYKIGMAFRHAKDYERALSFFEKALEIQQKAPTSDDPTIEDCNKNIEKMKAKLPLKF